VESKEKRHLDLLEQLEKPTEIMQHVIEEEEEELKLKPLPELKEEEKRHESKNNVGMDFDLSKLSKNFTACACDSSFYNYLCHK